ncbi:hypothetical protein Ccl03g_51770 [Enterocloster clostridioformis]|nr:hypothetical protein Ccl03g_51770 [Enterocloster clostridioformis]
MTGSGQTHIQKWRYGMNERLNYEVGDIVMLKKPHPCGSSQWEILRVGADFRLKCMGCGHQIMIARRLVEKNTRGLTKAKEDS